MLDEGLHDPGASETECFISIAARLSVESIERIATVLS